MLFQKQYNMWSWFIHGIAKFIVLMFNGGSDVSSKRVNGTMCISTILLILLYSVFKNQAINPDVMLFIKLVFFGGLTLLGVSVLEKFIK